MKIYNVGGSVRDDILQRPVSDYDWLIVGATESDIQALLDEGYAQVGADFPVFLHPKTGDEYALARVERKTGTGYHGFSVRYDSSVTLAEDLGRRDFTINSMARDMETGDLYDHYGGLKDLHNHVLRHTSEAFSEDPLRVLRLARFFARYNTFTVHPDTEQLCRNISASGELNSISEERIWVEIQKAFKEEKITRFFEALSFTGALNGSDLLNRVIGDTFTDHQKACAKSCAMLPDEMKFDVGLAAIAKDDAFNVKPNLVAKLIGIKKLFKGTANTSQEIYDLLVSCGAFRNGNFFNECVALCCVLENSGVRVARKSLHLKMFKETACDVSSSMFPDLDGKDLGNAIKQARIKNIQRVIDTL